MKNNKKHKKVRLYIVTFVLAAVLFTGVEIFALEKDKLPVKKETQKKKAVKAPPVFVPTDKVSADKAVAFPADI